MHIISIRDSSWSTSLHKIFISFVSYIDFNKKKYYYYIKKRKIKKIYIYKKNYSYLYHILKNYKLNFFIYFYDKKINILINITC